MAKIDIDKVKDQVVAALENLGDVDKDGDFDKDDVAEILDDILDVGTVIMAVLGKGPLKKYAVVFTGIVKPILRAFIKALKD